MAEKLTLPTDSAARKNIPLMRGCLDYFPAALAAVAELSRKGNEKHNPGEEMHHARGKSSDHADCIVRHLMDRGTVDPEDSIRHSVKVAWRALALLQEELEAAGEAPLARGAKLPKAEPVDRDEGWTPWLGETNAGPGQLAKDSKVDVRFRDGSHAVGTVMYWAWRHDGEPDDIVAYRRVFK